MCISFISFSYLFISKEKCISFICYFIYIKRRVHKLPTFYLHQRKSLCGVSTQVRMNCLKAENKFTDGQCVRVITNCNLVLLSLSFLSINQMMGKD